MKKILITGFSGFVASHFIEFLFQNKYEYEIMGVDVTSPKYDYDKCLTVLKIDFKQLDMTDYCSLKEIISAFKPDYVLHLAAYSSVSYSWEHPSESFINNCNIFLNLINAIRDICPDCRILSVGSSEEYGNVTHENLPIRENQKINPLSPYAVARVSQEMLSRIYTDSYGMDIIMTRSFNHIGPRQDRRFVIPSFISRILEIKQQGKESGEIETGDLSIIRDFVDVRDVVKAYYLLLTKGKRGEIYNICSGSGVTLESMVKTIAEIIGVEVKTKTNPDFIRPKDNMEVVGSPYKIESELGWERHYKLIDTINDMVEYMSNCIE